MNLDKIVGNNIRGYRKKRNLTQEGLAGLSKLTSNYLACLERAEETISVKRLEKIAKVLKVEPYLLFISESYKSPQ